MQSALRPYVTAGVALVGASAIAVTPVAVPPPAIDEVRDAAVELSALVNPIDEFAPIVRDALTDLQALGQSLADDPAPILEQILRNQVTNVANLPAGISTQIGTIPEIPALLRQAVEHQIGSIESLGAVGQQFLENTIALFTGGALQDQFTLIRQQLEDGDYGLAFNNLLVLTPLLLVAGEGLGNLGLLPPVIEAFQQPLADAAALFPIAAGPLNNAQAALGQLPNVAILAGLGALSPVSTIAMTAGNTLGGLVDAARNGDLEAAVNEVITQTASAADSLVANSIGQLTGVVPTLVALRQVIASAITTPPATADVAAAPASAPQSFTLTAPAGKALPATKVATPSVDDKSDTPDTSGAGSAKVATSPDTKDSAKDGNLFTPGSSSTKGGRHRADNAPSFGKELRDAAEKTIKGITGLGRSNKSDKESSGTATAKGGESGSSSSGSAGSGGGSAK